MRSIVTIICVFSLFALISGCVQTKSNIKVLSPTDLVEQYITTARQLEDKGDLVHALKQYQLALTVDSQNQYATEKISQLRKVFKDRIVKHYSDGLSFNKKGQYRNARREFLKVLMYDPDHSQVLKILKDQKLFTEEVEGYLIYKIQTNETISLLAKKYYGDSRKFQIIAEYNQMEDATKIRTGQTIKIPVIDGTFFFKRPEEQITLAREIPESELTDVINVKSDIIHVVQPGESLSKLAQYYYGDITYYSMLAQYNQLYEDAGLQVGKEIKVPEIIGLPLMGKSEGTAESETVDAQDNQAVLVNPIAKNRAHGLELFEAKKFEDAINTFNEVLDENPDDSVSLEYVSLSHFQQGLIFFGKEEYLTARDEFQKSLQYNEQCKKCGEYIKKSEETYIDTHYLKGLIHYRNEELEKAAKEWELVYSINPEYKDVANSLKKVRSLIERLEGIKQSNKEKDKQ